MIGQQAPPMHRSFLGHLAARWRSMARAAPTVLLEVRMNAKPAVDGVVPGGYVEIVTGECLSGGIGV